jgi:hypothetical protein
LGLGSWFFLSTYPHAYQPFDIFPGRLDNLDPRVEIFDPLHRQLEDAVVLLLAFEQQLSVKEPGLIFDLRHQLVHHTTGRALEATLRVAETMPEHQPDQQIVAA